MIGGHKKRLAHVEIEGGTDMNQNLRMIMTMMIILTLGDSCTTVIPAYVIKECVFACAENENLLLKVGSHTFKGNCCECTDGRVIFLDEHKKKDQEK